MKRQKNQPSWNYVECFTIMILSMKFVSMVRYSNVVKVVWIAMPGVRSKRYALVDCTKFYYKYNILCMFESPI